VLGGTVALIAAAPRKADLPRVIGEVRGALREDDGGIDGMVHDEEEHRRGLQRALADLMLALEIVGREELFHGRARREARYDVRLVRKDEGALDRD